MIFNSIPFLAFIIAVIPIFYLLKGRMRMLFILLSSYFFYGWWDWRFLSLIVFSTFSDYLIGYQIGKTQSETNRKLLLILSLITNLGMLAFFKYFNFFIDSLDSTLGVIGLPPSGVVLHIILPVGISFYTFQTLSYTIDVYRKEIPVETDFLKFASYISFFPQLVAGPIVRAADFLPQMNDMNKGPELKNILKGLDLVMIGYFKKVVIADSLSPLVGQIFENQANFNSINLIIGMVFFTFQIYCDFSGYSDIAIGFARMMGFEFPKNFNLPFISRSFSEFWRRWHTSLSSWLRDYLYISMGGNRKGKFNTYRNLMLTMVLGGLWHGASWNFIGWGILHGSYLVIERLWVTNLKRIDLYPKSGIFHKVFEGLGIIIVFSGVCIAFVMFRTVDFNHTWSYLTGAFAFNGMSLASIVNKFHVMKGILLICILFLMENLNLRYNLQRFVSYSPILRAGMYAVVIWIISFAGTFLDNQFIYFQF
ncbi:MBOAT family protein [Limibacter armeniacum]|uniref:MBOAT family O-acyltransferase n=1 Tax=Limibacter armeniacum TaxID=466084 RepID=UPI002FE6720F